MWHIWYEEATEQREEGCHTSVRQILTTHIVHEDQTHPVKLDVQKAPPILLALTHPSELEQPNLGAKTHRVLGDRRN